MLLPEWTPLLGIVTIVLVWVLIPTYVSWKYDMTVKDTFRSLWLYATGRTTDARLLLLEREDRTKPLLWFYWIPFAGRIFMHNRDMKMHPELRREYIISFVENTAFYFVVGLAAGHWEKLSLQLSITVISILFLIITPIEYKLTLWKPKMFLSDGDIDYAEYVCVFYHAYWFIMTGTLIGYFTRGLW